MAAASYDACLTRVLAHEGGYTNNPSDPGGPTNYGITIYDVRKYINPSATASDVRSLSVEQAKLIYRAHYWDAMNCDQLPAGVDYAVFDYGVNSGIGRSVKVLQRLVGVQADGDIGPVTMAAVRGRDAKALAGAICDERLAFLKSLKTWPVFGNGWGRRVADVRSYSLQLATKAAVLASPAPIPAAGKGHVAAPPPPVARTTAKAGAPAGIGIAAVMHWLGAHALETCIVIAVAFGAIVFALALIRQRYKAAQEAPTPGIVPVPAK